VIKERPGGKQEGERLEERKEAGRNNFAAGRFRFKLYFAEFRKRKL